MHSEQLSLNTATGWKKIDWIASKISLFLLNQFEKNIKALYMMDLNAIK